MVTVVAPAFANATALADDRTGLTTGGEVATATARAWDHGGIIAPSAATAVAVAIDNVIGNISDAASTFAVASASAEDQAGLPSIAPQTAVATATSTSVNKADHGTGPTSSFTNAVATADGHGNGIDFSIFFFLRRGGGGRQRAATTSEWWGVAPGELACLETSRAPSA